MGMYTELCLGLRFKEGTPAEVIDTLNNMVKGDTMPPPPDHPLFGSPRWYGMLRGSSYYFAAKAVRRFEYDDISKQWHLSVICNFKNYDSEIDLFLSWIAPHVDRDGFVGYHRYEEDEAPTLLYLRGGEVVKQRFDPPKLDNVGDSW
jgi:hypothetical protein